MHTIKVLRGNQAIPKLQQSAAAVSLQRRRKWGGKTVTITATAKDGSGKKASYKIYIKKGIVKKVYISGVKSVKAGKKLYLKGKTSASAGANRNIKMVKQQYKICESFFQRNRNNIQSWKEKIRKDHSKSSGWKWKEQDGYN